MSVGSRSGKREKRFPSESRPRARLAAGRTLLKWALPLGGGRVGMPGMRTLLSCFSCILLGSALSLRALTLPESPEPEPLASIAGGSLEGPAWDAAGGALYFSCQSGAQSILGVYRWTPGDGAVRLWSSSNKVNGNAVDAAGRVITCESGNRRVVRRAPGQDLEVLVGELAGQPLNEPNDVTVAPDGAVWFTTPSWSAAEAARQYVIRMDPVSGAAAVRVEGIDKPNGLAFSPDGAWLYLNDNGTNRVLRYSHHADGTLGTMEVLAEDLDQWPDGLAVDSEGNLFVALWGGSEAGVLVLAPDGRRLGHIAIPGLSQGITNTEFGGPQRRHLFITAGDTLWRLDLTKAYPPPAPVPTIQLTPDPQVAFPGAAGQAYAVEQWQDDHWSLLESRSQAGPHRVNLPAAGALVRVLARWQ